MGIAWDFESDIPTIDYFEGLELTDPPQLSEAVERFISDMQRDRFRTWEAVMRWEQGLPTTLYLRRLASEVINVSDRDDRTLYIDGMPRYRQPWYECFRTLAERMLIEPLKTFEMPHQGGATDGWPRLVAAVENRSHGLSLPEGIGRPLEVVPAELRDKLWLQVCFDVLSGLGRDDGLTLENEEQQDRIEGFIGCLCEHRDSVERLGLTLDSLLGRVVLPGRDRPVFVRLMGQQLGLPSTDAPLARYLPERRPADFEPVGRLSVEAIQQALLHPEVFVRVAATDYFATFPCTDPTVARLAIQAIEQYGWEDAFFSYDFFSKLTLAEESLGWLLQQLQKTEHPQTDDWSGIRCDLARALPTVDPALLQRHQGEIARLPAIEGGGREIAEVLNVDRLIREVVDQRIEYLQWDRDQLWQEFEGPLCEVFPGVDDGPPVYPEIEPLRSIVDLLVPDDRLTACVLEVLARRLDDPRYSGWSEGAAVQLAGHLRLNAAIPYLIPLLHGFNKQYDLADDAVHALVCIGSDEVVDVLAQHYRHAEPGFRWAAAIILENIHSDRSASALLHWLRWEPDPKVHFRVLRACLNSFLPAAIEPARQALPTRGLKNSESHTAAFELLALCILTETELPEWEAWDVEFEEYERLQEQEDQEGDLEAGEHPADVAGRWGDSPASQAGHQPPVWDADELVAPLPPAVAKTRARVGRNDPCPCGSGKKYKKCCLRKQG